MAETLDDLRGLAAIVVHHRRHDSIGTVIAGLLQSGLPSERVIVVDNSEEPHLESKLREQVLGSHLFCTTNRGYGAAVNDGLEELANRIPAAEFVLVATHEVSIDRVSLAALTNSLRRQPGLSAAGPTLITGDETGKDSIWSTGGYLTRFASVPAHHIVGRDSATAGAVVRDWLDGAAVVYRREHLSFRPFDETFFLYMEEVDLHLRLGYAGHPVAWVPSATAYQTSSGTPPRLFARNLRYLHRKHRRSRLGIRSRVPIARRAAGLVVHGHWRALRQLLIGATEALPAGERRLIVVNPLGASLAHYSRELRSVALHARVALDEVTVFEPSASGTTRISWIRRYVWALRVAAGLRGRSDSKLLVIWPVLGFIDIILISAIARSGSLVVHDPRPLVRAVGYDRASASCARVLGRGIKIVAHSELAKLDVLERGFPEQRVKVFPHPILPVEDDFQRPGHKVLRVMGQYKADRDTDLMAALRDGLDESWEMEVYGRGWPAVPGWRVQSAFISEAEFDAQLRTATVVLIPYRRFYQSGVAIRALEVGTPVVGPAESVLSDVLDQRLLYVSQASAETAVRHAATLSQSQMRESAERYRLLTIELFASFMGDQ